MAKLIFVDKKFSGQVYELVLEKTTLGQGDQNILVIHDNSLSTAHCEILVNGSEVIVRDLDSRNGTWVNGVRLQNQQAQLKDGETVRFGAVEARLELTVTEDGDQNTELTAVYAHRRAMRGQRWAQAPSSPKDAHKQVEPNTPTAMEEHTLLLPLEAIATPALTTPTPLNAGIRSVIRFKGKFVVIAAVAMLGLMLLLWLLWRTWGRT